MTAIGYTPGRGGSAGAGSPGPQGPPAFVNRGVYSGATTYAIKDAVTYTANGVTGYYLNLLGSTGVAPLPPVSGASSATWQLIASPGSGLGALGGLTVGEETLPRLLARDNNVPLASGSLVLAYVTATKTESITKLITGVGNAGSGGTKSRMGVYSTDRSTGALTGLLASTPVGTTDRWTVSFQNPNTSGINNVGTLSASWSKTAGTDYAIGLLFVGTTAPNIVGGLLLSGGGDAGLAPRISAVVTGQTDLPSTVAAGSLSTFGYMPYVSMVP